jgi:hypothetical protein
MQVDLSISPDLAMSSKVIHGKLSYRIAARSLMTDDVDAKLSQVAAGDGRDQVIGSRSCRATRHRYAFTAYFPTHS